MAWVVDMGKGLVRVPRDQDALEPLPIRALAIAIGSTSGQIWTATANEILRIDGNGVAAVRTPFGKPSGQVWMAPSEFRAEKTFDDRTVPCDRATTPALRQVSS